MILVLRRVMRLDYTVGKYVSILGYPVNQMHVMSEPCVSVALVLPN
jgi:hypothetical protein